MNENPPDRFHFGWGTMFVSSVAWPSWPWFHGQDARATVISVAHEDIHYTQKCNKYCLTEQGRILC